MTTPLQAPELEADSVTSTPRSFYTNPDPSLQQRQVRFMCSFGGKILPRPQDNQLRYVGGDTRIVAVNRHSSFASLLSKLSKLASTTNINVKYQLPTEDLDSLITVSSDEDVENMMEEYDRLVLNQKSARLRLFLFPNDPASSRSASISSFLDGSSKREQWFLDALNAGSGLERGRSEVSSIVSEVPDYLFGLDNADEPSPHGSRLKNNKIGVGENASVSDPSSPAPVVSSPFCSTSSALGTPNVNAMPDLPPVKTKLDNTPIENGERVMVNQTGYTGHQMWNYSGQPVQQMPVYYVQPGSNIPVQPLAVRSTYAQPYPLAPGQVPVGYSHQIPGGIRQVYGGLRPTVSMDQYDGGSPLYYGVRNAGMVPTYQGVMAPGMDDWKGSGTEERSGRASPAP